MATENKFINLTLFYFCSYVLAPWMLVYNLWGNMLYQDLDGSSVESKGKCSGDFFFKTYFLLLLICVYLLTCMYFIFVVSMRECMKRYFVLVYKLQDHQVEEFLEAEDESAVYDRPVSTFCGWSIS